MTPEQVIQFRNTRRECPRLTDYELENLRKDAGMTVKGTDVPYPVMKLSEAAFPDALHKVTKKRIRGGVSPLAGQVWATLMSGRDAVVTFVDPCGQPCTNLFLPPAIAHALNERQSFDERHPIVLILCDNEKDQNSIRDIYDEFCIKMRSSVESRDGNTNPGGKLSFCFASPQGLLNLLDSKEVTLDRCNYVILYSLSGMLEKGYEPQVREVFKKFSTNPQILVLSFKWNVLLQSLGDKVLSNYVIISINSHRAEKTLNFPNSLELEQKFFTVKETDKYDELKKIIEICIKNQNCNIVVYATSQKTVNNIFLYLQSLNYSVSNLNFGSNFPNFQSVLQEFKNTRKSIVVSTKKALYVSSVRNVGDIDFAVNFDFPSTIKFYRLRVEKEHVFRVTKAVYSFMTIDDHLNLDSEFWTLLYKKDETIFHNLIPLLEDEQLKYAKLLKYFKRKVEEISLNNE